MEPLSLVWGQCSLQKKKRQQLHCKTWDKSWQKRSFSTWGKAGSFSRTVGKEEQHQRWDVAVLTPLGSGIPGQAATSPQNCRENPPKTAGKIPPILLIQKEGPRLWNRSLAQEMFGLQHSNSARSERSSSHRSRKGRQGREASKIQPHLFSQGLHKIVPGHKLGINP